MENKLHSKWVLWIHARKDDWSLKGFLRVIEITSIQEYWEFVEALQHSDIILYHIGLMRDGVTPIWEDPQNVNGGCWSFKVDTAHCFELFIKLGIFMVGENIMWIDGENNSDNIMGLCMEPKNNFNYIIQLWNNDRNKCQISYLPQHLIKNSNFGLETLYRSHKPEY
uniref:Initiation factor 4E n=1 Tax=Megaviridae environmental sample TaxID=1737588 RepID=A0A5J6VJG9_9VIRU|nr:MAG: initiation factor 4E [Megaviridae environmental sample]